MGTVQGELPSSRYQLGLASVGDSLYVFGGNDRGESRRLLTFYSSSKDICFGMDENTQPAMYCESIILVASNKQMAFLVFSRSLAFNFSCALI